MIKWEPYTDTELEAQLVGWANVAKEYPRSQTAENAIRLLATVDTVQQERNQLKAENAALKEALRQSEAKVAELETRVYNLREKLIQDIMKAEATTAGPQVGQEDTPTNRL